MTQVLGREFGSFSDRAKFLELAADRIEELSDVHEIFGLDESASKRWRQDAVRGKIPKSCRVREHAQLCGQFAEWHAFRNPKLYELCHRLSERPAVVLFHLAEWKEGTPGLAKLRDAPESAACRRYLDACAKYRRAHEEREARIRRTARKPKKTTAQVLAELSGQAEADAAARERARQAERRRLDEQIARRQQWRDEAREQRAGNMDKYIQTQVERTMKRKENEIANREQAQRDAVALEQWEQIIEIRERFSELLRVERCLTEEPDADHVRVARRLKIKHIIARGLVPQARKLIQVRRLVSEGRPACQIADRVRIHKLLLRLAILEQHYNDESPIRIETSDNHEESIIELRRLGFGRVEVAYHLGLRLHQFDRISGALVASGRLTPERQSS